MAILLAVGAALANAITTIMQRIGVETAPKEASMKLSLITHAIHRRVWVYGMALMVGSFGLQAFALARGRLSVVQPILTLELPFLVLILVFWFGQRIGWHEVLGATASAGGLAAFLTFANPQGGDEVPNVRTWGIAAMAGVAAIAVSVGLARRGPPSWRAAWFGASAAISYAFTAAFAKEVTEQLAQKWYGPFLSWQIWGMATAGILGIFLTQNAFHAGPVTASQSTLVIIDPLVSLLIGIGLFGDNLQTGGVRGPFESLALIVLFGGVYFLARSPLVATVRSEEEQAHILGGRLSHHRMPLGLLGAEGAAQLAQELSVGNLASGDLGHGETGHGDLSHGEVGHSEVGHAEAGHGEVGHSEVGKDAGAPCGQGGAAK